MALSLAVLGRVFDWGTYAVWSVLSVPGVLYVLAGLKLRGARIVRAAGGRNIQV